MIGFYIQRDYHHTGLDHLKLKIGPRTRMFARKRNPDLSSLGDIDMEALAAMAAANGGGGGGGGGGLSVTNNFDVLRNKLLRKLVERMDQRRGWADRNQKVINRIYKYKYPLIIIDFCHLRILY